jgi:hypothetical protein
MRTRMIFWGLCRVHGRGGRRGGLTDVQQRQTDPVPYFSLSKRRNINGEINEHCISGHPKLLSTSHLSVDTNVRFIGQQYNDFWKADDSPFKQLFTTQVLYSCPINGQNKGDT